jgi:hypothetical protein
VIFRLQQVGRGKVKNLTRNVLNCTIASSSGQQNVAWLQWGGLHNIDLFINFHPYVQI